MGISIVKAETVRYSDDQTFQTVNPTVLGTKNVQLTVLELPPEHNKARLEFDIDPSYSTSATIKYWPLNCQTDCNVQEVNSGSATHHSIMLTGLKAESTYQADIYLLQFDGTKKYNAGRQFKTNVRVVDMEIKLPDISSMSGARTGVAFWKWSKNGYEYSMGELINGLFFTQNGQVCDEYRGCYSITDNNYHRVSAIQVPTTYMITSPYYTYYNYHFYLDGELKTTMAINPLWEGQPGNPGLENMGNVPTITYDRTDIRNFTMWGNFYDSSYDYYPDFYNTTTNDVTSVQPYCFFAYQDAYTLTFDGTISSIKRTLTGLYPVTWKLNWHDSSGCM